MNDMLVLHTPVDSSLVDILEDGKYCIFGFDLLDLDVKIGSKDVYKDEEGNILHRCLNHHYESLPTSFTSMSFKFYHEGHSYPYVELKASPAKILQGHNVYGSDDIEQGALEMLGYLAVSHPTLYSMLAVSETEVKRIDVTYSARLRDEVQVEQAIEFLRNVSSKHIRKGQSQVIHKNTHYWGSVRGKRFARKVYGKYVEFMDQLDKMKKAAASNDKNAKKIVSVMEDPQLQEWAKGLLRFETSVKCYLLKELGIPTNLFQLIRYQRQNPNFLCELWLKANEELFKALEGKNMNISDHDAVFRNLCSVFQTVTPSGRVSLTKARNVFNFYCALQSLGEKALKTRYSESQFYNYMSALRQAGYSKAMLQNLHKGKSNIIPFVKLIEIKFDQQVPSGYIAPVSSFYKSA